MRVRLIATIFAMAVIAIPFDAIAGLKAFGELGDESSFYFFALAMGLYAINAAGATVAGDPNAPRGGDLIWRTGAAIVVLIAVSALWNATDILAARFHDRDGFVKLATSATVVIYGLALALLTRAVVPGRWYTCLTLPICISAVLCVGFGSLEALDRAGVSLPFYQTLSSVLHAGSDQSVQAWDGALNLRFVEGWDKRLRTVSFEPPAFGNFAGLAWPWLFAAIFMTRGARKVLHVFLLLAFTVLIVGSQARTGWLLLATNVVAFGLLKFLFLPPDGRVPKSAAFMGAVLLFGAVAVIIFYAASFDDVIREAAVGTSVSDLSRLAYQVTCIKMFSENPILGIGLGQFAFKAISYMPDWGFVSSEVKASLQFIDAPWPNTYSLYARLVAELGLIGLFGWIAIWIALMVSVRGAGLIYANLGRSVPVVAYPIIMSCADVLVTGLTTDTFRTPMIWIALGAGAAFSARVRQLAGGALQPSTRRIPSQSYLTPSRS
ncbi:MULTISPECIES: O-antigen ligase family protein [unclassified Bradyrhizobium]|uniref:O-antigen ligase family protein n=1 Tax=unclassified Bradyrhizobium TaxID=2631580 RepID=UPI001FFB31AC|nr:MULTISPECIES: O-antigen ligase family protein [unclassified Bradyrhizobium]MCK1536079.1 O-antigen ligase family protein [Bradyrhizobium sp. 176]MCK1557265.1 O-antigen ligase family protein [Bradyrhizobium sp. 171]